VYYKEDQTKMALEQHPDDCKHRSVTSFFTKLTNHD